jgi:hypothetical protein
MFTSSAEIAATAETLSDALCALSPGEIATYTQLSKLAGESLSGASYVLRRALKLAEERSGALFENVTGRGYKRLETTAIPAVGKKANGRIRGVARRTRKRFESVRANDMNQSDLATVAAYRSHFGMIEGMARENNIKSQARQIAAASVSVADAAAGLMGSEKKEQTK